MYYNYITMHVFFQVVIDWAPWRVLVLIQVGICFAKTFRSVILLCELPFLKVTLRVAFRVGETLAEQSARGSLVRAQTRSRLIM